MNFPVQEDEAMSITGDDNVYYYNIIIENSSLLDAFMSSNFLQELKSLMVMLPLVLVARPFLREN